MCECGCECRPHPRSHPRPHLPLSHSQRHDQFAVVGYDALGSREEDLLERERVDDGHHRMALTKPCPEVGKFTLPPSLDRCRDMVQG